MNIKNIIYILNSLPPKSLILQRYFDQKWLVLQKFAIKCDLNDSNCIQLPKIFNQEIFSLNWTNQLESSNLIKSSKIQIIMDGFYSNLNINKKYYAINEIRIIARCDCNGFSSICNVNKTPYECNCNKSSYTAGFNVSIYNLVI